MGATMISVVCVYSSTSNGLDMTACEPADYAGRAAALRRQFREHFTEPHEFVCLTDAPREVEADRILPLRHDWGGWWAKVELFAWPWEGRVIYCDLDNVLLGNVDFLAEPEGYFIAARDWDYPVLNSSLMAWTGPRRWIYDLFCEDPVRHAATHNAMPMLGDQSFISSALDSYGIIPKRWQQEYPSEFASRHDAAANRLGEAKMVLWHSRPKPWQLAPGQEGSGLERVRLASLGL
jgi:hypothetical protein